MKILSSICAFLLAGIAFAQTATLGVKVLDPKGKPYAGDKILFVGQQTKKTFSGITNAAGSFRITLPQGDVYDIRIQAIGEELEYNTLEIPRLAEGEQFEEMQLEITYEAAQDYTLSSLQFETAKATIRSDSFAMLDVLAEIMTRKPGMKIEVAGHTDSDGEDAANLELSRQRAEAVKQYLTRKGIAAARIVAKGYGETQPVAGNDTPAGKAKNRRTEIHIR